MENKENIKESTNEYDDKFDAEAAIRASTAKSNVPFDKTREFSVSPETVKKLKSNRKKSKKLPIIVMLSIVVLLLASLIVASFFVKIGDSTIWDIIASLNPEYKPNIDDEPIPGSSSQSGEYTPAVSGKDRKEGVYNFLIGGFDKISMLSDVMMIVTLDTNTSTINVTQLPRDTYIQTDEPYAGFNKLNSYFLARFNKLDYNLPFNDRCMTAASEFEAFLEENLSIKIDGYAFVTLSAFKSIVDIFGGVDVYVPFRMYYNDPAQNLYIDLYEGMQHLDGETAEQFIRFRKGLIEGDIGRIKTQKIFISAFINKVKTEMTVSRLVEVAKTALDEMITSISVSDCVYYAKEAFKVDMQNVRFLTLSGDSTNAGASFYVMNRADSITSFNALHNVYTSDITSAMFDRARIFTDPYKESISSIYDAKGTDNLLDKLQNSEDIEENSIPIPHF